MDNYKNTSSKILKYILMGTIVYIAARYIPSSILNNKELLMIGATSSIAFAILDMISPTVKVCQDFNNENKK